MAFVHGRGQAGTRFTARGAGSIEESHSVGTESNGSSTQFSNVSTELTRNDKYVVSKLAATPVVLSREEAEEFNALLNSETSHALVMSPDIIYSWNYNSADGLPTTVQLPVMPSNNGFPPLATLVRPSAGTTEPGIACINSHTGDIRFFENFENASSIGLLQFHKGIVHRIKLYERETITLTKNVEPAGILLATSTGRIILLSLRDSAGKPYLSTSEIVHRQTGFFNWKLSPEHEITSIQTTDTLGQGETLVVTATRGGKIDFLSCARDGQSKHVFHQQIFQQLVDHLSELYPQAAHSLEVLDLSTMKSGELKNFILLLTAFQASPDETYYVLFTIKKENEQFLIFSAYRLNTYTTSYSKKPSLCVPEPYSTAFIIFENSVVLTELITSSDTPSTLKRKWEDVVSLRSDVEIIGYGPEDQVTRNGKTIRQAGVCIAVPGVGVLRIERLKSSSAPEAMSTTSVLKSHIEQAVYYGYKEENPIEFDLPENLGAEKQEVATDLLQLSSEILSSTSSYIPPKLASLEDHLELRRAKLEKLVRYTSLNFLSYVSDDVKFALISALEKITAAARFYKLFSSFHENETLMNFFSKSISHIYSSHKASYQTDFFQKRVDELSEFLSTFLLNVSNSTLVDADVLHVVTGVFSSILEVEKAFRYDLFKLESDSVPTSELWFSKNDTLCLLDDIFQKYLVISQSDALLGSSTKEFVEFVEVLFYLFQQKLQWLYAQPKKTRELQDTISKYEGLYKARSGVWTKTLVLVGAKNESLAIAEAYKDLRSLVEISDEDRENAEGTELDLVYLRFDHYFNKFGYEFAETLYSYYISVGKFQVLLLGFQQYNEYLKRFLTENEQGKIAWVRNILDGDFKGASKTLLNVTKKFDDTQTHRHLQLSIAKLSAIASLEDSVRKTEEEELIEEIQEELDYVEVQDLVWNQIKDFIKADSDTTAQVYAIVQDLFKTQYRENSFRIFKKSFERALIRLLSNKSLSVSELIDTFTLINSVQDENKLNYFYALKLLHLSKLPYNEKILNEKLIWRRAILNDDWSRILQSENKTAEYIKEKSEQTALFSTLLNYFKDQLFDRNNDYSVRLPNPSTLFIRDSDDDLIKRFKFISIDELPELENEIEAEIALTKDQFPNKSIDQWIKAMIGTANERSGKPQLINYDTLSLES